MLKRLILAVRRALWTWEAMLHYVQYTGISFATAWDMASGLAETYP